MENLKRKGCSESSTQERKRQKGEAPQDPAEKEKWQNLAKTLDEKLRKFLMNITSSYKDSMKPTSETREVNVLRKVANGKRDRLLSRNSGVSARSGGVQDWELDLLVLTFIVALFSVRKTNWNAAEWTNRAKVFRTNPEINTPVTPDLLGYFKACSVGLIDSPTIVVDKYGRMLLVSLPSAISPARVMEYQTTTRLLEKELRKNIDTGDSWRDSPALFRNEQEGEVSGVADISFAWFAQGHEKLNHDIHQSPHLDKPVYAEWMTQQSDVQYLNSAMLYLVHKMQYMGGATVVSTAKAGEGVKELKRFADLWASVFTGITIIANRVTPIHRDGKGHPSWFDLLLACGSDSQCFLEVPDLGARVRYHPGDACLICGRILSHAVTNWDGSGRIAYAHYNRPGVVSRFGVNVSSEWPTLVRYGGYMDPDFVKRQAMFRPPDDN